MKHSKIKIKRTTVTVDEQLSVAYVEKNGRNYGLRFATGTTASDMEHSIRINNLLMNIKKWLPYNSSTDTFI